MRNLISIGLLLLAALGLVPMCICAQGTFANLDFEAANLPSWPAGQSGGSVPIAAGLPGWAGYLDTNSVAQVMHNDSAVSSVNISILGPFYSPGSVLEGSFTVLLQAGIIDPFGNERLAPASISQTGLVPSDAQALLFRTDLSARDFRVTLGGSLVPVVELSASGNYKVWGGNIPGYANTLSELRLTALSTGSHPFNNLFLDAIVFSNQQIPEPRAIGLLGLGATLLGWRFLCKRP